MDLFSTSQQQGWKCKGGTAVDSKKLRGKYRTVGGVEHSVRCFGGFVVVLGVFFDTMAKKIKSKYGKNWIIAES